MILPFESHLRKRTSPGGKAVLKTEQTFENNFQSFWKQFSEEKMLKRDQTELGVVNWTVNKYEEEIIVWTLDLLFSGAKDEDLRKEMQDIQDVQS